MAERFFTTRAVRAQVNIKPDSLVLVGVPDERGAITPKIIDNPTVVAEFRRAIQQYEVKSPQQKPK